jgi:chitinase
VDSAISIKHISEQNIEYIRNYKKIKPDLKLLLSVGGWGHGGFSPMASTFENRQKFADSALSAMETLNLDGIDIDWEYPCIGWANIESSPDDKVNFTLMLNQLRETLNSRYKSPLLTIAVGAGKYFTDSTEMDKIAPILDYVSLMTYDMHFDNKTGHHTNLYPSSHETVK